MIEPLTVYWSNGQIAYLVYFSSLTFILGFSNLRIVEIPDGIEWEIDDYDGMETIEEKHGKWTS